MRRSTMILWAAIGAASLAALGGCAALRRAERATVQRSTRAGAFRWVDPLLDCEQEDSRKEIRPFKGKLQRRVDSLLSGGRATHISIYFRDLRNGPWFGINEREEFLPASLLKVPLMIGLLDQAEERPELLSEALLVPTDIKLPGLQHFSSESALSRGATYPVTELISRMIRNSDNIAAAVLISRFGAEGIRKLYDELGVDTPADGVPDFLRVKDYAALFRLLYNASYLDRRGSERALEELAHSEFMAGMAKGIPPGVPVAHKYGERQTENGEKQLHDCGIVYYPKRPYLLCIMTRGGQWESLASVIEDLSATAYREIAGQVPRKQ